MELGDALNWFEIPVTDFDRAKNFYETILTFQMPESIMGPARMGFFLYDFKAGKVGGAIVHQPGFHEPSKSGALIYLNCQPDLQVVLNKVQDAGGSILIKKTIISEEQNLGYYAVMLDSEGNRVALHSMN
jgi:predicted enzyme related to lactoylglutathione lyase